MLLMANMLTNMGYTKVLKMGESKLDKHYEEKFEIPLWRLIKQRAEEKDISYAAAIVEVVPEYERTIGQNTESDKAAIQKRAKEMAELAKREREEREKRD